MSADLPDRPGRYEIRLLGHLDARWAARFDEMTLTTTRDGSTVIEGPVVDQAALHGLLRSLHDIGLPLLSVSPTPPRSTAMTATRKTALVAGTFYLITFLASIPALILLTPILRDPVHINSARLQWGALLDIVNAFAGIGTAVTLFPVVKRQNEAAALGFVTSRVIEAAVILIGVVCLLALLRLSAGPDTTALAKTLVAVRDWTFLLGPGVMPALNAVLLGSLLYRSRLVPRVIPAVGLLGAPLLLVAALATLFGHLDQVSPWAAILTLPVAAWEFSVGVYLVVKGFRQVD